MQFQFDSGLRIIVKIRFTLILCAFAALGLHSQVNAQTITGNVFRDFNANGVKDISASFNEVGVGGVTVKCTDSGGSSATTTTSTATATLGDYSLSGCTAATRVEFVWGNTALYPGANGTGSNTSVQFINAARASINFGINNPAHYSNTNPNLATAKALNGNPLAVGTNLANDPAFYLFPNTATGNAQAGGTALTTLATQSQIGTTWGTAFDRTRKKLFMASVYKRHASLGPGETGGRIFVINDPNGTPSTPAKFLDLVSDLSISVGTIETNAARGLGIDKAQPTTDNNTFTTAGKVGLGDLDISDDGQSLFVVNLYDKLVYKINIAQVLAGTPNATALPAFTNPNCTNGVPRPWGLGLWDNELYLGIVCSGETGVTTDLKLIVQKFNFSTSTWSTVLSATPDWEKGDIINNYGKFKWQGWEDTHGDFLISTSNLSVHPQPILGDIEFDAEGSMHLAVLDRLGFQVGHRNYVVNSTSILTTGVTGGELLRTYKDPSTGSFALENNASVGPYTSSGTGTGQTGQGGANTNQGPGGGEFYADDHTLSTHSETTNGGLAQLKGTKILTSIQMDPLDGQVDASGVLWWDITSGLETQEYQIFFNASTPSPDFSKQNGLGDLEYLSDPAPLEIGNRVWLDTDKDGIQDPDEAGIDGVVVTLMIGSEMVTTTTATVNGQAGVYYFKDGMAGLPATWGGIIPRDAVAKLYVADTYTSGATTYKATVANVGTNDAIDADGIHMASQGTTAASVRIDFNTGLAGQNNHTYDFGYNVDTLMNFLNCAEVDAQDQTDIDSTPSDGTGDEYACATTTKTTSVTYDWGDNPDTGAGSGAGNYLTSTGDNGPRHQIVTGLKLGATVDAETDGQGTGTTSTGDDTNGVPDDEDGVTLPTFTEGVATPLNFTLMNMTGAVAKLCGWIDFNKDGVYDNTTERQCTNVADLATTATLTFTAPAGTAGTTYARFRLSTDAAFITAMDPTGVATSGEVEDYQATITAAPIFDLALDKKLSTGQATTVNAGDLVSFDITVYNQGSVAASGISITDYVDLTKFDAFPVADNPAGNSTVTVLPYTWSAAGVATLTGTLPMGASLKIPVKLRIKAGATGIAVNKAEISAATGGTDIDSTPDGTDGNQTGEVLPVMVDDQVTGNGTTGGDEDDHDLAQVTINVPLTADLELIKIADKTQVRVGDLLTYTLQITNKGPGTATAVKVKDTLPIGVSLQGSPVASVGTFDSATGIWTVGDMLNGSTATLTIVVKVQ